MIASLSATLNQPESIALDSTGNLFISEPNDNIVEKVSIRTGTLTDVTGYNLQDGSGDGGPAASAGVTPLGLALDRAGNLYIADNVDVVREVDAQTGIIRTVAGRGGVTVADGDGGSAAKAGLVGVQAVAVDSTGNLFIGGDLSLREVHAATGLITTISGITTGVDALALDQADNLFVAGGNIVQEMHAQTGTITAIAGTGRNGYGGDGGPARQATLSTPDGLAVDGSGNLYIADSGNNVIREVIAGTGKIVTIAGTGQDGYSGDGGQASRATLSVPGGLALDTAGDLFVADSGNNVVRVIGTPGHAVPLPSPATPHPCAGARDLIVQGVQTLLTGTQTFDRVCVVQGGTLVGRGLVLRTGYLSVAAGSRISADGAPGFYGYDYGYSCEPGAGTTRQPDGASGSSLSIIARTADIAGTISVRGGAGADPVSNCDDPGGNGGHGGIISLSAVRLTLKGSITAEGGSGVVGGVAGSITITTPRAGQPSLMSRLHAAGGRSSKPGTANGAAGTIAVRGLTTAGLALMPSDPAPLLQSFGQAATRRPLQNPVAFQRGMACGPGDLDLGPGATMRLAGTHTYAHVCLHDGATLVVPSRLTLRAETIFIDSRSAILADAAITATTTITPVAGLHPATPPRAIPSTGVAGAKGDGGDYIQIYDDIGPQVPYGGNGGGAVALVASRILLAGRISATGADGQPALANPCGVRACGAASNGAGGGSGGGILILADELQLSGGVSVIGGLGGAGGDGRDSGAPGRPGQVTLLVNTLRVAPGGLPISGPALIGRTLPGELGLTSIQAL